MARKKYLRDTNKLPGKTGEARRIKKLGRIERLRKWYKELKDKKKCVQCGESEAVCLDFHHINKRKKKNTISRMVSIGCSKMKIYREMLKCEILCAACHRLHHQQERDSRKVKLSEMQKIIRELKNGKTCSKCGRGESCVLDFHHSNPAEKSFAIGNAIKMKLTREEILVEVKKTEIICCNCHRKLHNKGVIR